MSFEDLAKDLQKSCKGTCISLMSESEVGVCKYSLPGPYHDLNRIITGDLRKFVPEKKLVFLVGNQGTFKSSNAAIELAEAQKAGFIPVVIDTEGAWTPEFISRWGGDPSKVIYIYQPFVDKIKVVIAKLIERAEGSGEEKKKEKKIKKVKKGSVETPIEESETETPKVKEKYFIVLDSIGGIMKQKVLDDALEGTPKGDQGAREKEIKPLISLLSYLVKKHNSIGIMTGHFYGNSSGYGSPTAINGGKAPLYWSDIVIAFSADSSVKNTDETISNISAITLKNRVYPRGNEAKVQIDFVNGINPYAGIVDLAIEADIIKQAGAWFEFGPHKVQGMNSVYELLNNDKVVSEQLIDQLNEYIKDTGFSTMNLDAIASYEGIEHVEPEDVKEDE